LSNVGTLTVSNSTLSGNSASDDYGNRRGGGIFNDGTLTVSNSTLSGNTAGEGSGGGIYNYEGTLTVSNSTLSGNSAGAGGGIFNFDGTLTVSNSTLSGNTASYGGGIYIGNPATLPVTLTNVTLTANRANYQGGGLYVYSVFPVLHNTLIAGNFYASGTTRDDVYGALDPRGDYNLIGDGTGMTGLGNGVNGNLVGSAAAPIDPLLSPLQDNGGPTQTHALLPGSPAIDAGDNTGAPMWDQRGPGFPRIEHGIIDIGAFEYRPAVQVDPNPVPISEPGPGPDTMEPGIPEPQPTLDLAVEALATAVPVQSHSTVYPVPLSLRAFVHGGLFAEPSGHPLLAGWEEN
jgi:hypothetical protein